MSAALPCTGAFCAMRSPIWRMRKLSDDSSGSWRRRPNSVVVKPVAFASRIVSVMYAAMFGNAAKYASRISRAWSVGMSSRVPRPYASMPYARP